MVLHPFILQAFQFGAVIVILAGLILLAVALWRAAVLPRWVVGVPVLAIIGALGAIALPPLGPIGRILLYLALASLGRPLLRLRHPLGTKASVPTVWNIVRFDEAIRDT